MSDLLPFLIIGLVTGSIYGLAGIGLVLTYKTSGIFNFAHGALATIAAYTFYELWVTPLGLPWGVALVVTLVVLSAVLGLSLERLGERLSQVSLALRVVATVGLILVVEATYFLIYGPTAQLFPEYLPTETFRLGGVNVGYDQAIIFGVSAALMAALYLLFRTTQIGRQMRAVVDDSSLVDLTGVSATSVRRWAWVAGCFLVSLSGILLAPSVDLDPVVLTLLIVQAFGAAAIGGFSSLPLTWFGGLAIGVAASVATKYVGSSTILAGLPPSIPFLVLFVVILFRRRERAYQAFNMAVDSPSAERWRMPIRIQGVGGVAVLVVLLLVPTFDTLHLLAWTTGLITVVLLLSLGLLVRLSGQVSLCQISFAAIGVVAFSHIDRAGVPWVLALVLAGLVVVPLGALLAIPAIRLSGLYLALATFGFGLLLQDMFYQSNLMFGPSNVGIPVPRPSFASGNEAFYYVVLAVTVVIAGRGGRRVLHAVGSPPARHGGVRERRRRLWYQRDAGQDRCLLPQRLHRRHRRGPQRNVAGDGDRLQLRPHAVAHLHRPHRHFGGGRTLVRLADGYRGGLGARVHHILVRQLLPRALLRRVRDLGGVRVELLNARVLARLVLPRGGRTCHWRTSDETNDSQHRHTPRTCDRTRWRSRT